MAKAVISEKKNVLKSLKAIAYPIIKITEPSKRVNVYETIPFRVKFTNIGISGYGPGNVPPIGIAIIGVNNYIL